LLPPNGARTYESSTQQQEYLAPFGCANPGAKAGDGIFFKNNNENDEDEISDSSEGYYGEGDNLEELPEQSSIEEGEIDSGAPLNLPNQILED
jgi:hypothetical protein